MSRYTNIRHIKPDDGSWKRWGARYVEPKRKGLIAHLLEALRKPKGAGLEYMERNVP